MQQYDKRYTSADDDVNKLINTNKSGINIKRLIMQILLFCAVVYGIYVFFTSKTNLLDYLSNNKKSVVTTIDRVQMDYKENKEDAIDFYLKKDLTISGRYVKTLPSGDVFYIGSYGGESSIYDAEVHVMHKEDRSKIANFGLGTGVKIQGKIVHLDSHSMVINAESFERVNQ